ncbi:MAG: DNA primase [Candidatus Manganitrophaceae bacterium]
MTEGSINDFQEVKRKLDIVSVIEKVTGQKVNGKGRRYTLKECPFCRGHGCFSIRQDQQYYKCFQCPGEKRETGGDVFSFVAKYRGIDNRSALEELAREVGHELRRSHQGGSKQDIREVIMAQAKEDWKLPEAEEVWRYLVNDRQLSPEVLRAHDVGYLGERNRLIGLLKQKGFSFKEIEESKILTKGYGDFYQVLFGWREPNGKLSGFVAGATRARLKRVKPEEEDDYPKYKNNFDFKVDGPFNLFFAKRRVPEEKTLVVVEGLLDCFQMLSKGFYNTIALGCTHFSDGYGKTLLETRYRRIILLLDNDKAGREGTERAIQFMVQNYPQLTIYVTEISSSDPDDSNRMIKDPDELIVKCGAEVLREVIGHPAKAGPWWVLALRYRYDMKNALERDKVFEKIASQWRYFPDEIERKEMLRYLGDASGLPQEDVRKTIEMYVQQHVTEREGRLSSEISPPAKNEQSEPAGVKLGETQRQLKEIKEKYRDLMKKQRVLLKAYVSIVSQVKELSKAGLLWHVTRLTEGHLKLLKELRRDPVRAQGMIGKIKEIFRASHLKNLERINAEIDQLCNEQINEDGGNGER